MIQAIKDFCKFTGQKIPEKEGEIAAVIYKSLALCYGKTVEEIEKITHKKYTSINIVGGGANADYLNQLTADATGKIVYAGPTEATAIGNIAVQILKDQKFENLEEARKVIYESFKIKKFEPYQE
jgi:rhamnulokinase